MQSNKEERNIQQALGSIPKVHNQRAYSATVTIAGVGLGDITVNDVRNQLSSQHELILLGATCDQMYVHKIRAYGTAGGYLSMSVYPHRQYCGFPGQGNTVGSYYNSYITAPDTNYRAGSLTQMYEFGINGATRPELTWDFPKDEILNNPFTIGTTNNDDPFGSTPLQINSLCKLITIQSTNTGGDALYIVQFDVTIRNSNFVEIAPALGAAAFGEKNVVVDNYLPPLDIKKKIEEGNKAHELANKKRKVENVKALTMPALDAH